MGMSSAERQRKYRQKRDADPQRRQLYLAKERQKYDADKAKMLKKSVRDMTDREKRSVRKQWRKRKQASRKRLKKLNMLLTPPQSPESANEEVRKNARNSDNQKKKRKREMAKCYRDNLFLKEKVVGLSKRLDMYKKRFNRMHEKSRLHEDSPRTKTNKLLKNLNKRKVKRTLILHNAMVSQIKQSYKGMKNSEKKSVKQMLSGAVLKKYGLKCACFKICNINHINKRGHKMTLSRRMSQIIHQFYTRDDNSRVVSGIKNTVTKHKDRKQRRILNESLKNLHAKFLSENKTNVSYTTFCRLRPFWVLFPTERDRDTCLCKLCENTKYMAVALKKFNILDSDDLDNISKRIVCCSTDKRCMFGECTDCADEQIIFNKEVEDYEEIKWIQWRNKTETRKVKVKAGVEEKVVSLTIKEEMASSVGELEETFQQQIRRYTKHTFTVRNQFQYFRTRRESLQNDECIIHIDFSENYVCKMSSEIQSMHFGASKKQLTLHTGVYYVGKNVPKTFCTVSENLNHGPCGVWAHLKPVLKDIKQENPHIQTLDIFSDGPTTQYKQKTNFFLFSTETNRLGFSEATWNFLASGHGKGVPDAVGGALKRKADNCIKYGADITSAEDFKKCVKGSKTDIKIVREGDVILEQKRVEGVDLKSVTGTLKIHQLKVQSPGKIVWREVSCTCNLMEECKGHKFSPSMIKDFGPKGKENNNEQNKNNEHDREGTDNSKTTGRHSLSENEFKRYLKQLQACKSFDALKKKCELVEKKLNDVRMQAISIMRNKLQVDMEAIKHTPGDISASGLFPCEVKTDGNCLPSCGSVFTYGSTDRTAELRLRIIVESVLHEKLYLDNTFLSQGLGDKSKGKNLPKQYAQYSDMYIPGMTLNEDFLQTLYEMEVMKIRTNGSYMGIWQMHALASVLQCPILSVYPKLGCPTVQEDLNRIILPRQDKSAETPVCRILWTSTRKGIPNRNWVPNHFVAVVPMEEDVDVNNNVESEVKRNVEETICTDRDCKNEQGIEERKVDQKGEKNKRGKSCVESNQVQGDGECNYEMEYSVAVEPMEEDVDVNNNVESEGNRNIEETMCTDRDCKNERGIEKRNMIQKGERNKRVKGFVESIRVQGDGEIRNEMEESVWKLKQQVMAKRYKNRVEPLEGNGGVQTGTCKYGFKTGVSKNRVETWASKYGFKTVGRKDEIETELNNDKVDHGVSKENVETRSSNDEGKTEKKRDWVETGPINDSMDNGVCQEGVEAGSIKDDVETGTSKGAEENGVNMDNMETETNEGGVENSASKDTVDSRVSKDVVENETNNNRTDRIVSKEVVGRSYDEVENEVSNDGVDTGPSDDGDEMWAREDGERTRSGNHRVQGRISNEKFSPSNEEVETEVSKDGFEMIIDESKNVEDNDERSSEIVWSKIPEPSLCVGKHVIVRYNSRFYPGLVLDSGNDDLLVQCMHQVGKKKCNRFFWPKKMHDRCWYDSSNILALIPEPIKIQASSHFAIDESIWQAVSAIMSP